MTMMIPLQRGRCFFAINSALKTTIVVANIRAAFYGTTVVKAASVKLSGNGHIFVNNNGAGKCLPKLGDVCVWKPPTRYSHPAWCSSHHGTSSATYFCKRYYMTEEEILKDPDCLVEELKLMSDAKKAYVIDVRQPEELQETGKIPDALNIPLDVFEAALKLDNDTFRRQYNANKPELDGSNFVINCRSGVRSLAALKVARNLGFHRSRHLPGGFLLWKEKFEDFVVKVQ